MKSGPVVVSVQGVTKIFRVPTHRATTFKERATHPLRMNSYQRLLALDGRRHPWTRHPQGDRPP